MAEETIPVEGTKGAFAASLVRNNKKIREDRAIAISEDTQVLYKRTVEDLEIKINKLKRERENMLDLSPTDATSLVLASDFNTDEFIKKDMEIGFELRNLNIKLEIAKERYKYLFGE
jgi:predicted nucleotidyltransferase